MMLVPSFHFFYAVDMFKEQRAVAHCGHEEAQTCRLCQIAEARQRLRELIETATWPRTKMARMRELWPEVDKALKSGRSYENVRQWLASVGIEYTRKTLYDAVAKLRRSQRAANVETNTVMGG